MRPRDRILASLEGVFREAWERAEGQGDAEAMARIDFEYQCEQLRMEVLLDIRELLVPAEGPGEGGAASLLERAEALRRITRLR